MKYFATSHSDSCNKYYIYIYSYNVKDPTVSRHLFVCFDIRTNNIIGNFLDTDEDSFVAKDPKEALIKQLE